MVFEKKEKMLSILKQKYNFFSNSLDPHKRKIGTEMEFHVIPKNNIQPNLNIYKKLLTNLFTYLNFEAIEFDNDGNATKGKNSHNDFISFEYGYAILEISLAPELDLNIIHKKMSSYITKIQTFLKKENLQLLPFGINPFKWKTQVEIINNTYYQMVNKCLSIFNKEKTNFFNQMLASICATQLHIDLSIEELINFYNISNQLTWIKALLFANSPYEFNDTNQRCYCMRDIIWQKSTFSYDENNSKLKNKHFNSYDEILLDTLDNSIFHVIRNNEVIYFQPTSFLNFLGKKVIEGKTINSLTEDYVKIIPKTSDIKFLRQYNPTVITSKGTVEIRSECQQPFNDMMSPLALHLGIVCNIEKIKNHFHSISQYVNETNYYEMRLKAISKGYQIQKDLPFNLINFIYKLLLLIQEGLEKRNYNEERFLTCLFHRLENQSNPATEWFKKIDKGLSIYEIANNESQLTGYDL